MEEEKEEVAAAVVAGVTRSRMNESRYTGNNLCGTKKPRFRLCKMSKAGLSNE